MTHCEAIRILNRVLRYIGAHHGATEAHSLLSQCLRQLNPLPYHCGVCGGFHEVKQ